MCSHISYVELIVTLRDEISSLSEFFRVNKLTLNAAKIKLVIFSSRAKLRNSPEMSANIDGIEIESVSVSKYLGIFLDSHLTFELHIIHVYKKLSCN